MKGFMQTTLAALMLSGMISANAQDAMPGQASMEINMKIMQEVMTDIPQDKMADAAFVIDKTIAKMKDNIPALKEAAAKDCVALHGDAKADACKCAAEKTDYDEVFAMMKKQATSPETNLTEEAQKLAAKAEENTIACGFTKAEIDAANEKAMQMMQESMPKQ
ncbi:MAG: hypothetical protein Q4D61_06920 [Cardiobacteriaceae bacterium]|nr:hypothetical protein [Cardiobacteriaceae bacterium]